MPLNREQILSVNDRRTIDVSVPEWGDTVRLAVMTGTERESFEREWTGTDDKLLPQYKLKVLRRCLVDEKGATLFTDNDLDALGEKRADVIDRLFNEAMKLNGLLKDSVEELAKN